MLLLMILYMIMIIFIDVCMGISIKPNQALGIKLIASLSSIFIAPNVMLADDSKITTTVQLDISINRGKDLDTVVLGLYGDDAPQATKYFIGICKGDSAVSYDGAMVSSIVKDKEIKFGKFALGSNQKQETYMDEVGKVRLRNKNLADNAIHNDNNGLNHDTGSLSVPKGGGSFEFSIIPLANQELNSDHLVIGKVLSGIDTITKINSIPVTREDILGTKNGFSSVGKAFDGRAKIASVNKPLKRIQIKSCSVDEKASLTSFLKF